MILVGALLAAVGAQPEDRSRAALAFVEALSSGLVWAGGIALGIGFAYLAWVLTHPPSR